MRRAIIWETIRGSWENFPPFPIHRIWTRLITGRRTRVPRRCYASVHKPGAEAEKYKTMAKTISLNVALSNRRPCLGNPNTRFDVGKGIERRDIWKRERPWQTRWVEGKLDRNETKWTASKWPMHNRVGLDKCLLLPNLVSFLPVFNKRQAAADLWNNYWEAGCRASSSNGAASIISNWNRWVTGEKKVFRDDDDFEIEIVLTGGDWWWKV